MICTTGNKDAPSAGILNIHLLLKNLAEVVTHLSSIFIIKMADGMRWASCLVKFTIKEDIYMRFIEFSNSHLHFQTNPEYDNQVGSC